MAILKKIFRYPIKGLSGESLNEILLEIVFWVSIDTLNLYKMLRGLNTQEILQENTIIYQKSWKIFQKFRIFY